METQRETEVAEPDVALREQEAPVQTGAAVARFASAVGNQRFGNTVARNGGASGTAGVAVSSKGVKFSPEGSFKTKEYEAGPVGVSVGVTLVGEAELTWKEDDSASYHGAKGSKGPGGEKGKTIEEEIPVYQDAANKELAKKKDKALEDHFKITDASVVLGADFAKRDSKGMRAGEASVSPAVGVKLKTVGGTEYTIKVSLFSAGTQDKGGKIDGWEGPKLGGEADIPLLAPEAPWEIRNGVKLNGKLSIKPNVDVKPNYKLIWQYIAQMGVAGCVEFAGTMIVIFAPAMAMYASFSMMHDQEALLGSIFQDAKDIKGAASSLAFIMSGSEPEDRKAMAGKNPRIGQTLDQAAAAVNTLIEARGITRKTYELEMLDQKAYSKFYSAALENSQAAYRSEVREKIHQWWEANDWYDDSKEADEKDKSWYERMRIGTSLTLFKQEEWVQEEATKRINMAFEHKTGLGSLPANPT